MDYLVRFKLIGLGLTQWSGVGVATGHMIVYLPGSDKELYYDLSGIHGLGIVPNLITDYIHIPADTERLPIMTTKGALQHYNVMLTVPTFYSLGGKLINVKFQLRGLAADESGTNKPPIFSYDGSLELMGACIGGMDLNTSLNSGLIWDGIPKQII